MKKQTKILLVILIIFGILALYYFINPLFNSYESFNGFSENDSQNTIIITSATGDMKGLEVGVASYAGKYSIPLILASKTIPYPLSEWIPLFKEKNDIKKAIVIGPVSQWQIYLFRMLNLKVEKVDGSSKAEILTKIAEKTYKSLDTVIITPSDPSASLLGAVMDVPVLVVAEPGKYTSSETMPPEYDNFISKYHIKRAVVVGQVSSPILDDLKSKNLTVEEIKGDDSLKTSFMVSDRIIDIQRQRGFTVDSAYCGFYGELPSIVPLATQNHSIIIQDPTIHMDETVTYLKDKGITDAVITRNSPADYLQMEEPDFVSGTLSSKLGAAGINMAFLTSFRTVNEATGLYETKIMAAELLLNGNAGGWWQPIENSTLKNPFYLNFKENLTSTYPPLLDIIIIGGNWESSTGFQLFINKVGLNMWFYQWKGVHPYLWQKDGENWYCYSPSNYSWQWIHANQTSNGTYTNSTNDTWTVNYLSNGKIYYRVYWVKKGNMWEEIHTEGTYNWQLVDGSWVCTKDGVNQSFILFPTFWINI